MAKLTRTGIVEAYANAYRVLKNAESALADLRPDMESALANGPQTFDYGDGSNVTFTLVEGNRVNPVSYVEAQAITLFGHARMAKLAGPVDRRAVEAYGKLGELRPEQVSALLPTAPYLQIRGKFGP